jgi:hypothetical protein
MVRLTVSADLYELLPDDERRTGAGRRCVTMAATSWDDVVTEARRRFPLLASRVFTESGSLMRGFVLVVNDEVVPRGASIDPAPGDDIYLLAALAGG